MMTAPILDGRDLAEPSAFTPESLLREARRQKGLPSADVPAVCVLDPDGDIVRDLIASGRAQRDPDWACYHTQLHVIDVEGLRYGIIGGVVGASFAVLVAEELFAAGCQLLLSMTSAGQITPLGPPPYFILIDRALRDEGTSYHYLAPARYVSADPAVIDLVETAIRGVDLVIERGSAWTTDAPFRETATEIAARRSEGVLAVEMEAAALYAFARARDHPVICFAHITNQMGQADRDFDKGEANGARDALRLIEGVARALVP
ncbi:MAG TPA: nucleoside phosphorylase [Candidatus Saccharimonadales bacterium]|nr:nucleoside phosphorylase [Candidatus Saccharimonadales bacterium]